MAVVIVTGASRLTSPRETNVLVLLANLCSVQGHWSGSYFVLTWNIQRNRRRYFSHTHSRIGCSGYGASRDLAGRTMQHASYISDARFRAPR
jgi:hypothetical protein